MRITINIEKRHLYFLAALIVLVGVGLVVAVAPNPGHSWSQIGDLPGIMWHSNSDGAGSGLDADMIDGLDSSQLGGIRISDIKWFSTACPAGYIGLLVDDDQGDATCLNSGTHDLNEDVWQGGTCYLCAKIE